MKPPETVFAERKSAFTITSNGKAGNRQAGERIFLDGRRYDSVGIWRKSWLADLKFGDYTGKRSTNREG
jgi:hypothetical protein